MYLVALICFASVAYQGRIVSPLSMAKPNEASQNCCIRSKCVRFNTPPISIWFYTRYLHCLQLRNKFSRVRLPMKLPKRCWCECSEATVEFSLLALLRGDTLLQSVVACSATGSTFGEKIE